jgi:alkylated DNA repair protein (DNA oxidative demethylase)
MNIAATFGQEKVLMLDLFDDRGSERILVEGAMLLRGLALSQEAELVNTIEDIAKVSPFRNMVTPGGFTMSVAMSNCGAAGWVTDRKGYRYTAIDPETGKPWPALPDIFRALAAEAADRAGYPGFEPDACLINRYEPGARMTLHQDKNERDYAAPIVSVSLGLPATFLFGGKERAGKTLKVPLVHGDVVVWGGPSRMNFHGVNTVADGVHPLVGRRRLNLTFRRAL